MKTLISLLFLLLTNALYGSETPCLTTKDLNIYERLKWSPTENLLLDSILIEDIKNLVSQNKGAYLKRMLYDDIRQAKMNLSNQQRLSKYVEEAATLKIVADQHMEVWSLLANTADIRFNELMNRMHEAIKSGELVEKSFQARYVIQRLDENGYSISPEPSLGLKLFTYIKDGRWDHISRSLITTHRDKLLIGIALITFILLVIFFIIKIAAKKYTVTIKINRRYENSF